MKIQEARERGLEVVDATCPIVLRAQEAAQTLERDGYQVVIVGDKNHAEIKGIIGALENPALVLATIEELHEAKSSYKLLRKIGVIFQTTLALELCNPVVNEMLMMCKEIRIINTICRPVQNRQDDAIEIAAKVDLMIVVGSRTSANTVELAGFAATTTRTPSTSRTRMNCRKKRSRRADRRHRVGPFHAGRFGRGRARQSADHGRRTERWPPSDTCGIPRLRHGGPPVQILFALPEEAKPFPQIGHTWSVQVACSGAGARNAQNAAKGLISPATPFVLICGFAGGLNPECEPGDIVVAEQVIDNITGRGVSRVDSALFRTAESICASALWGFRRLARHAGNHRAGPDTKRRETCLDCETPRRLRWIWKRRPRIAHERKVPWLSVRVITDGLNDTLPLDFNALADEDGNVNNKRVICAALTHPWKIPALIRLGTRSSLAANNLATFLKAFLEALP